MTARKKERVFRGIAASPGIVIGQAVVLSREKLEITQKSIPPDRVEEEVSRFLDAINATRKELEEIRKRVLYRLGEEDARLFDAHLMILDDRVIIDDTIRKIREERLNAEYVYFRIMRDFHDSLMRSDDEYLRERGLDILDVKRRVIRKLQGAESCLVSPEQGMRIVVAHQLTPSQTIMLDRNAVLGFAIDFGGKTSHVAILARGLGKPAVVGLKDFADQVEDGDRLIVDGNRGLVILHPGKATLLRYRDLQEKYQRFLQALIPLKDLPAQTLDGHKVELGANIELPQEVESAIRHGARGIGLFRTEYMYLARRDFPDEEEQYQEYKRVAERVYPHSVIIRTFDLGGDRLVIGDMKLDEENPFLGWRSIRISLDMPDIFLAQLKAILRASERGNVRVMFPMISSVEEVRKAKELLHQAMEDLDKRGLPYDRNIEVGVMVEVPAAVMILEHLAAEVQFFSIGTNDLIQYTLAVDRGNERIAHLYTNYHPAVLKLIKRIVEIGHKANRWVGLCGEMAADPLIIPFLVGIGLDELSVTPVLLPEVKKLIRSLRFNSMKRIVDEILEEDVAQDIEARLQAYLQKEVPDILEVLLPQFQNDKNERGHSV